VVDVQYRAQLRFQFGFGAHVVDKDTGVDVVRLTFDFAASQIWQEAPGRSQQHRGVCKRYRLAIPKTEGASGELLMVEYRIKASRGSVKRLLVARGPEESPLESQPVTIDRQFGRSHLRVYVYLASRDGIVRVGAEHFVERVSDNEPAQMSVSGPTQIRCLYPVRREVSDQRWSNEKPILVEVTARPIVVVMKAELRGVSPLQSVLPEEVCYEHRLIAKVRRVRLAVFVLLEHVEVSGVELISVVAVVAKRPDPKIGVAEYEPSKVAYERLDSYAYRRRIEVCILSVVRPASLQKRKDSRRVAESDFAEGLLK